ncbi:MAG: type II toxin-antitoxin system HicA family toxin [Actinomycetales bacterium]|nr:type II toxin-antitoxin system HicA family toxin [Actinomycetales bacterium]
MKTRKVIAALTAAGCEQVRSHGRHAVYRCPCGGHMAPVPVSHTEVTAGVLNSLVKQLPCLPKGWLS